MKKSFLIILILIIVISSYSQEKRLALVIGNSNYHHGGALKNPVNDANLMANTLEQLGFDVIKRINADLKTMQLAEVDFKSKLSTYNVALFYYAGHGVQVDGRNFLIPIDAKLDNKELTKYEAFNINNINEAFRVNNQNINIMILDACRDDPFKSWERGGERGFKKIESSKGTIIGFATQPGATAADGIGSYGLYTSELIKQMSIPQSIEEVFKNTRIEVDRKSSGGQTPQEWTSLMGNFYFTLSEIQLNDEIKTSGTEALETYKLSGYIVDARDNQKYKWVKIGDQVWMAENLCATKYNDGRNIPLVTDNREWKNISTPAYSWYNNNSSYKDTYGALYNWYTVNTGNLCPTGWHVPTDDEWATLKDYLGGEGLAGGKLKETGTSHWSSPNTGATNETGFTALPGGYRNNDYGNFHRIGSSGDWWSSTGYSTGYAWGRYMGCYINGLSRSHGNKVNGLSVRCLRD